jgi:phage terminase Nu1 subunit (DNA packaging protein)
MTDSPTPPVTLPTLSVAQAAFLLGCSTRTVRTYLSRERDPLPAERGNGRKSTHIPLQTFMDWVIRRRLAELVAVDGDEMLDPRRERALLDRARRHLAELDRRVREGELLERTEVVTGYGRLVSAFRDRMLAIPSTLGAVHGADIFADANRLIREALLVLSTGAGYADTPDESTAGDSAP